MQAAVSGYESSQLQSLDNVICECLRLLRNACAHGESVQNEVISDQSTVNVDVPRPVANVLQAFDVILKSDLNAIRDDSETPQSNRITSIATRKMCWQCMANVCVQNGSTQQRIWLAFKELFFDYFRCSSSAQQQPTNQRECTMILFNIYIGGGIDEAGKELLELLLTHLGSKHEHKVTDNDFFDIFLEHFIVEHRRLVPIYARLTPDHRLWLLYFIGDYMKNHHQPVIQTALLQYICKEFKMKSDCILKTVTSYVDAIKPKEVVALLDVVAQASSDERYTHAMQDDGGLFLNVGCLLQTITKLGKSNATQEVNIFAPVQQLGQIAPNSDEDASIERDVSYQLKSMLVRVIGNLAYRNRKNQDLAREMDIILAVLDSTNLDARNPCKSYEEASLSGYIICPFNFCCCC